ncbi:N-acetyltransferase [Microbacteriaceae bacterium VKM Ac-2855]|nr:N-acetyltransferase [Microbacteriaceae bacterium VKM Ac-2855]
MAKEFSREADASRFAMHLDGTLVGVLDYHENGDSISLVRSFTSPPYRGRGFAAELVEWAVADIEAAGAQRIVPMCWYVGAWFEKHPEKSSLLAS